MTDMREIVVERDMMVPARDVVLLATDVHRPAGPGPYPVLLERTPYDKSAVSRSERGAADPRPSSPLISPGTATPSPTRIAGAAVIRVAVFTKYLSEAEDGFDALVSGVRPRRLVLTARSAARRQKSKAVTI